MLALIEVSSLIDLTQHAELDRHRFILFVVRSLSQFSDTIVHWLTTFKCFVIVTQHGPTINLQNKYIVAAEAIATKDTDEEYKPNRKAFIIGSNCCCLNQERAACGNAKIASFDYDAITSADPDS